jgi:hypothetical protein
MRCEFKLEYLEHYKNFPSGENLNWQNTELRFVDET